jgi:opacity protein-like surface antigen
MKKLLIASLFLLSSGLTASAQVLVGAEAGYLLDSEEEFLAGRIGYEVRASDFRSHQVELEIGYTDSGEAGTKADLLPVMANYRLVTTTSNRFGWHVGAGAGFTRARVQGVSTVGPVTLKDNSFSAQAFAGVHWQPGPSTQLTLGARYLWIDDVTFAGTKFKVGDDVAISAGVSFRF